ncbi:MAG TPA: S-layer homology domain-containing protein [Clostridiaceae bacterium]|nr:S-layer homology domain-containing protein [Clostridiaceae bacterium]
MSWRNEQGEIEWDNERVHAMAWMIKNGLIEGTGDGRIQPEELITRAEAVVALYNMLGKGDMPEKLDESINPDITFEDVPESAPYHEAVMHFAKAGVINGIEKGIFDPDGFIGITWYEWGNELNGLFERFDKALGISSVDVKTYNELIEALAKKYITEINIKDNITITDDIVIGTSEKCVDEGNTLTVASDKKLVVNYGCELRVNGILMNNGTVIEYGAVMAPPGSHWNQHIQGNEIVRFVNMMNFAHEIVKAMEGYGLEAPSEQELDGYRQIENWPTMPVDEADYAFVVKHAVLKPTENAHDQNKKYWEPYKRITHGEAREILAKICGAIRIGVELPESVSVDGYEDETLINFASDDLNRLINAFIKALGPVTDSDTEEYVGRLPTMNLYKNRIKGGQSIWQRNIQGKQPL